MDTLQLNEEENERVKFFTEYLEAETAPYKEKILQLLARRERRLLVDLDHLRELSREKWNCLVQQPMEYLPAFEKALKELVLALRDPAQHGALQDDGDYYIGFEGAIPQHEVNPRTLYASCLGKTVILEGIVTRCSLVRPKVRKSVHYCEATKNFHFREYQDATMIGSEMPVSSVYPTEDENQNRLETEFGLCRYVDFQTITIQEMPERAPAGQLPRSVDIILNADLIDRVKPGDRVKLYGVYRSMGGITAGSTNAVFRTVIIANNVYALTKSVYQRPISDTDIQNIKKIAKRKNVVDLLASSLAPSIYGHELIKKSILLQLLSGIEKNLPNGTHLRGDINLLMVGDPSTAKSQLLRFVLKMAPLAVATTGRGSSGVGLTAAVTTDKETGERRLEAGAMVLADRGIVCIDEFDKMSDVDRVAIHEVMEQQTVTIAKAGIHTSLNARCSVIAAANPQYGQYDSALSPAQNVALPDSLMSRFDLVFIVLDTPEPALDRLISSHVLKMHRFIPAGLEEGEPISENFSALSLQEDADTVEDDSPFEKNHPMLLSGSLKQILKVSFLKKYVHYAKSRIKPQLTEEASDFIVETYAELREKAQSLSENKRSRGFPVTPRTLEALIRLATAHAKARLSAQVQKSDAEVAAELVNFSMFSETKSAQEPKNKKKKVVHKDGGAVGSESETSDDGETSEEEGSDGEESERLPRGSRSRPAAGSTDSASNSKPSTPAKQYKSTRGAGQKTPISQRKQRRASMAESSGMDLGQSQSSTGDLSHLMEVASSVTGGAPSSSMAPSAALRPDRYDAFQVALHEARMQLDTDSSGVELQDLVRAMNRNVLHPFSEQEIQQALARLQEDNRVMVADRMIFFI